MFIKRAQQTLLYAFYVPPSTTRYFRCQDYNSKTKTEKKNLCLHGARILGEGGKQTSRHKMSYGEVLWKKQNTGQGVEEGGAVIGWLLRHVR